MPSTVHITSKEKQVRFEEPDSEEIRDFDAVKEHPLGVKPAGNSYTSGQARQRAGGLIACLPEELLFAVLENLEAGELVSLGSTCKAFYAYCSFEELWKNLFIGSDLSSKLFTWQGTWRNTYLGLSSRTARPISCHGVYSDILYRPFYCAHTPLAPFSQRIPRSNEITRFSDLTRDDFVAEWANKPFILTNPVREWPVYQSWTTDMLKARYGSVKFIAEAVEWCLEAYVDYMRDNQDESPLYLFDRQFVQKLGIKPGRDEGGDYWTPECFGEDLFALLGDQRPDSRWLIMGPERSGSTFHKDPNATSAWNAVLKGAKYWIMFPSDSNTPPPPGVYVSEDQSEVTSPLSIAEWLLGFHAEARRTKGCLEGICSEGEVLHVPSGWWHLVVNLSESIAITQNFIPAPHLKATLEFLRDKPDQVSGFDKSVQNPYETFVERLGSQYPELLEEALNALSESKKRKWDAVVGKDDKETASGQNNAFSFGFGDDDDEDVP